LNLVKFIKKSNLTNYDLIYMIFISVW